jgi:3-hydroxyisobutyrate dehydrogenase-like beta-hydroxyacid dehydrogenase
MKIGFIGLGKLGLPCAEAMAKDYTVTGYDIVERVSSLVNVVTDIKLAVEGQDIVFVAIQTPHHPDYDGSKPTAHLPNKSWQR